MENTKMDECFPLSRIVNDVADYLKAFDSTKPCHKSFKPGIGPFGEPQLVKEISNGLVVSPARL
jgi:hypothetical protein